jgi:hypothetical protein
LTNQKQELPVVAMFVNGSKLMSNLYRGPSKDAYYRIRFIWSSGFRGEDFLEINQSEKRVACGGHV